MKGRVLSTWVGCLRLLQSPEGFQMNVLIVLRVLHVHVSLSPVSTLGHDVDPLVDLFSIGVFAYGVGYVCGFYFYFFI